MLRRLVITLLAAVAMAGLPEAATAQTTRADTAQVLLNQVRQLQASGRARAAEDILRLLIERYDGTPAADSARARLRGAIRVGEAGAGRTGFVVWNTVFGTWLGLAIPAAFDAEGPEAYGAGILIGAPLGFFASKAYANSTRITPGQSGVISWATIWGMWQGVGWQDALDIGEEDSYCDAFGCYGGSSNTAPWIAQVVGGLSGLGVGLVAARRDIPEGTSAMITHGSLWGTWYGIAGAVLLQSDESNDDVLVPALVGGNIGLLAAIPASKAWNPRGSRVRIITAGGLLGLVAGFGADLLFQIDDDKGIILLPTIGSAAGLVAGALLGKDQPSALGSYDGGIRTSVIALGEETTFGIPLPMPAAIRVEDASGRRSTKLGLRLNLLSGSF
jgi:hypothetical protein